MNNYIASGYVQKKIYYTKNGITGEYEYKFYLNVYSTTMENSNAIPFKCIGWLADKAYAELQPGDYCEIVGELVRENPHLMYVVVRDLTYKKPKARTQIYLRTSEFLETFKPTEVIERLTNTGVKNSGKKK